MILDILVRSLNFLFFGTVMVLIIMSSGCLQSSTNSRTDTIASANGTGPIQTHYSPGDITRMSTTVIEQANASLNGIVTTPPEQRTFNNTVLNFDRVMSDYLDTVQPLSLMGYVYPDAEISAEGMSAEEATKIFKTATYSRRDLYNAIKEQVPRTPEESRLYNVTIREFKRNGLNLPEDRLALVRAMKANLSGLESQYTANLNNDDTKLEFTAEELSGVPASSLATFNQTASGEYIVTLKYPDYLAVMTYTVNNETRKNMYAANLNRQADKNTALLEEAIVLREKIAKELGYNTWADYRLDGRMAENSNSVMAFLSSMKEPLMEKNKSELAELLEIKERLDPNATAIDPWDIAYLLEKQQKEKYAYDKEKVREYFPLEAVLQGIFSTYGSLFGIQFDEMKSTQVWSPEVQLFRVSNQSDNSTIGYLYLDLFPREGKYDHFCENSLIKGRMKNDVYAVPVVAIIGNVHAPNGDTPSLLTPDEIETILHETGHAMHDILTTAPYGTLSGTNVEMDFVETPSQTLEEWAWDPQVLESFSGHYTNTKQKIPSELITKVIAARDVGLGNKYSSMLAYSLEDMRFHSAEGPVNTTDVWFQTYREILGMEPLAGTHQPATFGHLMGDYDAGYYGYLWSKVYALNILNDFKKSGMTNRTEGMKFRHEILSKGNMADGNEILVNFLGTKPGVEALYQRLGISVPQITSE